MFVHSRQTTVCVCRVCVRAWLSQSRVMAAMQRIWTKAHAGDDTNVMKMINIIIYKYIYLYIYPSES